MQPRPVVKAERLGGLRVPVGTVVGLVAAGRTAAEMLQLYPYLEAADIPAAVADGVCGRRNRT
ncbi:DUF433 domain-containing protein [bacterium]|nr:DUF433 domain-containing protein [bacterium]